MESQRWGDGFRRRKSSAFGSVWAGDPGLDFMGEALKPQRTLQGGFRGKDLAAGVCRVCLDIPESSPVQGYPCADGRCGCKGNTSPRPQMLAKACP